MLNIEGDSNEFGKTAGFCSQPGLEAINDPNYIHAAFVGPRGSEPAAFGQFNMEYIPHTAVLSEDGKFLANKVDVSPASMEIALNSIGKSLKKD